MSTQVHIQLLPAVASGCGSSCGTSCGPTAQTSTAEALALLEQFRSEFGERVSTEVASYRTAQDIARVLEDLRAAFAAEGSPRLHLLDRHLAEVLAAGPFLVINGRIVGRHEFAPYAALRTIVVQALRELEPLAAS